MEDKVGRLERLRELVRAVDSGELDLEDCREELEELAEDRYAPVVSLLLLHDVRRRYEAGEIDASAALSIAQEQADRFPALSVSFLNCALYSLALERGLDALGYAALSRLKAGSLEGEVDFHKVPEWEKLLQTLLERLPDNEEPFSARNYLEGADEHLKDHFLAQQITDDLVCPEDEEERGEWTSFILGRLDRLSPLLVSMLDDLLRLNFIKPRELPKGMDVLIRLVGCLESLETLPTLLTCLGACVGDPLNEAVLALARLGRRYPEEVSSRLREFAEKEENHEVLPPAVDALGLLWEIPGNLDFLQGMLARYEAGPEGENHLFRFLVHALLSSGEPAAVRAVVAALEDHRRELDPESISFAEDYLEHYRDIRLGPRLDEILEDKPEDFLGRPRSGLLRERRRTLTLMREDVLARGLEREAAMLSLDMVEFLLRKGRNEPCPCGSGLKFKKCCRPRLEELRESLRKGEEGSRQRKPFTWLMDKLVRYSMKPSIQAERMAALQEFLEPLGRSWFDEEAVYAGVSEEDFFEEWFLLSRPLKRSGKAVVQEMLEAEGRELEPSLKALLQGLASSRFSVFEVREVVPGSELLLRDMFRGEDVRVRERTASRLLVKWDLLVTRVGRVGDHHEMMGLTLPVPRHYLEKLEAFVERSCGEHQREGRVRDMDEFLQTRGHLLFQQVMHLYLTEPRPLGITPEGDEFTLCTATFDISDAEEAARRLAAHPYIQDEGTKKGIRSFSWFLSRELEDELRRGDHVGPQDGARTFSASPKEMAEDQVHAEAKRGNVMRCLGFLELRGKRLVFRTQSLPRLEVGKRELLTVLDGVAVHRADSIEDQEALLGKAWRGRNAMPDAEGPRLSQAEGSLPPEVLEKAYAEIFERTYGNWLDEPLPYLGGRTPREAAKTDEGRRLVDRLPKDYENRAERDRGAGKPAYDFSRFRQELDVWPE
ncbi:MAG: SEC-C metal-binding domain-containing protein [Actinomycetota bacterium]|nr:SEC-C metal-binding domain-containing protein [Actinomycetota bacterium]